MSKEQSNSHALIVQELGSSPVVRVPSPVKSANPAQSYNNSIQPKPIAKLPKGADVDITLRNPIRPFGPGSEIQLKGGVLCVKGNRVTYHKQINFGNQYGSFFGAPGSPIHQDLERIAKIVVSTGAKQVVIKGSKQGLSPIVRLTEAYLSKHNITTIKPLAVVDKKASNTAKRGNHVPLKWLDSKYLPDFANTPNNGAELDFSASMSNVKPFRLG